MPASTISTSQTFRSRVGTALNRLATRWATPGAGRVMVCSPIVGIVSGLGAVGFLLLLEWMFRHVLGDLMHLQMPPTGEGHAHPIRLPDQWWMVLLIPTIGGLISGLIVFSLAPEAEGHGTDALIRAFHRGHGQIRARVPLIKAITSIITIGTGGSAGQEGPIAQIGAGFGSFLARLLRLTTGERRMLMLAGAAGGVGAIFRAPLGGALFAGEVLYLSTATESAALLPCLTSSILAYSTFSLFITPQPIFMLPAVEFHGLRDIPLFTGLAVACAALGWLYVRVFYGMRDRFFHPMPLPRHLKPAVGGFLLGIVALVFPQLLTGGYGWVQWGAIGLPPSFLTSGQPSFTPGMGAGLLLMLAVLKTFTTGLTISSGGSGGVFGPSIFIGGMLGGSFGQLMSSMFPTWNINPAAFTLVGMGGFFAGVSKTPLTSIVMVSEMTGSYSLLVPLMLVCGLNMALSTRWTLYEEQVASPIDSPAHLGDFVVDVLEQMRVRQVPLRQLDGPPISEADTFEHLLRRVADSSDPVFPVINSAGRLSGLIGMDDLRLALIGLGRGPLIRAVDLARQPAPSVTPEDDLHTSLRRLTEANLDALPVVDVEDPSRLLGLLSRSDLTGTYTREIHRLRAGELPERSIELSSTAEPSPETLI